MSTRFGLQTTFQLRSLLGGNEEHMDPVILVHGGAGSWDLTSERLSKAVDVCRLAARAGQAVLVSGGTAIDAVETAVRLLEDSPILDAGRGSYLNSAGEIEMDALIMDGRNLDLGAVAAVKFIQNPISLARLVMTESNHNFLVASGAEAFAEEQGYPRCKFEDLLDEEHLNALKNGTINIAQPLSDSAKGTLFGDTVGAVARDMNGNLAAATSTGGTKNKAPGRIGDSPLVGSGAYADNWTAAVSATGHGETLMKVLISKRVCDFVATGLSPHRACQAAIDLLTERASGEGGVIAVDNRGKIGLAYNTLAMPYAHATANQDVITGH